MNCGAVTPSKEELSQFVAGEGLERFNYIPEADKTLKVGVEPDENIEKLSLLDAAAGSSELLAGAFSVGSKIILPDSTPVEWNPAHNKPYYGARRGSAWHPRTRLTVGRIRRKVQSKNGKPMICATYIGHGRTGIQFGIDAMISQFTQKANKAEEEAGDRLVNWAVRNWNKLNLNYIIYWNWMNDGAGWFDYEPIRLRWDSGSPNVVASRHYDHAHFQVNSPFIAGNE